MIRILRIGLALTMAVIGYSLECAGERLLVGSERVHPRGWRR